MNFICQKTWLNQPPKKESALFEQQVQATDWILLLSATLAKSLTLLLKHGWQKVVTFFEKSAISVNQTLLSQELDSTFRGKLPNF